MPHEVVERGDVFFLYRPKVELRKVEGLGDVQSFHVVLSPFGRASHRLLRVGRKRLPEVRLRQRAWAVVERVESRPERLSSAFRGEVYETKTRGERHQGPARAAGEGVYALVRHEAHVHLVYRLELPKEPGPPQQMLRILPRGSFLLVARNPDLPVDQPRRFVAATPELLDRVGADLVLIAVRDALDVALDEAQSGPETADIFAALRVGESDIRTRPLLEAQWE